MQKATILFADNNSEFLKTRSEFLEQEGYLVIPASNPTEARRELESGRIDLAILDIRLLDDNDEKDMSGLELAQKMARTVPKIILTGFPAYGYVREALSPAFNDLPPAVDFISKQEGPEALIQAVERAFNMHARINWGLRFHFAKHQSFHGWVRQIVGRGLPGDRLNDLAQEIEKLMRKLFYEDSDVFFNTIPSDRQGEVLAWVREEPSQEKPAENRSLLKCSTVGAIQAERKAFEEWRDILPREMTLDMSPPKESVHFAAVTFSVSADLEPVEWLAEYFQWHTAGEIMQVLENFADKTRKTIYAQPCPPNEEKSLNALYREQVGLTPERVPEEAFQKALYEVIEYMRSNFFIAVNVHSERITFQLEGREWDLPDPTPYVYRDVVRFDPPVMCRFTLGNMDGYNILVDGQRRTWVTDFAAIGPAPTLSDFIALEFNIRFKWTNTANIDMNKVFRFESQLSAIRPLEEALDVTWTGENGLGKALKVITHLRRLAAHIAGADPVEYHLGILFHAANLIVADTVPDRRIHALVGAAMTCNSIRNIAT